MKKYFFVLLSGLLLSCSGTKSAYTTQQELEAYLGKPIEAAFTKLTPEEQKSGIVVFDYQVNITGSKVTGIKLLDFINSGQVNYWIHFRTTSFSTNNKIVLPAPIPAIESSVDLFLKVTNSEGITYYKKNELAKFFDLFKGKVISDLAGHSRIELASVPPDYEIEYIMNQTLSSLPFAIGFRFIENACYRNVNIRIDTGNDFNLAYLSTLNSFILTNENGPGSLIEKLVDKNNKSVDGTPQLGGNISVRIDETGFNPSEPATFFFPLNKEIFQSSDIENSAILNLNRNSFYPLRSWSDFQRTGIMSKIKSELDLPGDTDTRMKEESTKNQKNLIHGYIEKIQLERVDVQGKIDPYFLSFDENYVRNFLQLLWSVNIGISNSGFVLEKKQTDVRILETTTKSQANSAPYAGFN